MTFLIGIQNPRIGFLFADTRVMWGRPALGFTDGYPKIYSATIGYITGTGSRYVIGNGSAAFSTLEDFTEISEISNVLKARVKSGVSPLLENLFKVSSIFLTLSANYEKGDKGGTETFVRIAVFREEDDFQMGIYENNVPICVWPSDVQREETDKLQRVYERVIRLIFEPKLAGESIHVEDIFNETALLVKKVSKISKTVSPDFHFAGIYLSVQYPYYANILGYSANRNGRGVINYSYNQVSDDRHIGWVTRELIDNLNPYTVEVRMKKG